MELPWHGCIAAAPCDLDWCAQNRDLPRHALLPAGPATGAATQTFNTAGLLATRVDSRGVTATYTYDAVNRLRRIAYTGGNANMAETFTYDEGTNGIDQFTSMTYPACDTHWGYDAWGHVTSETQHTGAVTLQTGRTYDTAGHLASVTCPSGRVLAMPAPRLAGQTGS